MQYRKLGDINKEISVLGLGCMRFTTLDENPSNIDNEKAIKEIRFAIDHGVNYIDTAYPYHGGMSETLVGKALQDGYREKAYLATKLPSWNINSYDDMERIFNEQLDKLQTDYIDFYLIHALNKSLWNKLLENNLFDFIDKMKQEGKIKHIGFSFHDDITTFKQIVDAFPWQFCMIQYNFMDTHYQAGLEGLNYAYDKGLGVIVMEPLRGGNLVQNVPEDIQAIWDSYEEKRHPANWALRFVWNNPKVTLLLSGMNSIKQISENIQTAEIALPNHLSEDEKAIIDRVKETYLDRIQVHCTACGYCMPCPHKINIPKCFEFYNNAFIYRDLEGFKKRYKLFISDENKANKCISCGICETKCPQSISIMDMLKKTTSLFQ